jgi:very-short-patch-repair endonuclease
MTLARDLDGSRMEALVDFLIARKSVSVRELARLVALNGGVPGVRKLRRIVEYRLPDAYQPPANELERLLYRVLDDLRLPAYTRQLPISFRQVDATVDAYISEWRLIVEGDGRRWHTRHADMVRDRLRDNEATAHGYAVLRFVYEQLRDEPDRVLDTLLRTGRVRRASVLLDA